MALPEALEQLDKVDLLVYDLSFLQHKSSRAVAAELGYASHTPILERIKKICVLLRPDDHETLRDREGIRLDELRGQSTKVLELALAKGDLTAAQRALREVHALTRTTIQLYGLDLQKGDQPAADASQINDLLDAYLQGAADATEAAESDQEDVAGEPG